MSVVLSAILEPGRHVVHELDEEAVRGAARAILVWSGPGGHGGATVAALAQQFAYDYPERCKKLVLAATAAGAVIKDWQAKGGKVLARSKPVLTNM